MYFHSVKFIESEENLLQAGRHHIVMSNRRTSTTAVAMESYELDELRSSAFPTPAPSIAPLVQSDSSRQEIEEEGAATADIQSVERELASLPAVDTSREAWQFCISALILETMVFGLCGSFGLFQSYYATHEPFSGESLTAISSIGSLQLVFLVSEGLLLVNVYKTYRDYVKTSMWLSGLVCVLSLVASSFAEKLWTLQLCQGALFGIFGGALYYPAVLWLPEHFDKRRGLAAGIIFGGSGAGGVIFPLMLIKLLQAVGFRWTLRILAALFAVMCAPAIHFCKPRLPTTVAKPRDIKILPPLSFVRIKRFWLDAFAILFHLMGYYAVSFYIPTYAVSIGLTETQGTYALVAFNAASTVAKVLMGWAADRVAYSKLMTSFAVVGCLSAFLGWGYASKVAVFAVFVVVFGSVSFPTPLWAGLSRDTSGPQRLHDVSAIFLGYTEMMAVASISGPLIAGSLIGDSSSFNKVGADGWRWGQFGYAGPTIFVGVSMAISAALAVSPMIYRSWIIRTS